MNQRSCLQTGIGFQPLFEFGQRSSSHSHLSPPNGFLSSHIPDKIAHTPLKERPKGWSLLCNKRSSKSNQPGYPHLPQSVSDGFRCRTLPARICRPATGGGQDSRLHVEFPPNSILR